MVISAPNILSCVASTSESKCFWEDKCLISGEIFYRKSQTPPMAPYNFKSAAGTFDPVSASRVEQPGNPTHLFFLHKSSQTLHLVYLKYPICKLVHLVSLCAWTIAQHFRIPVPIDSASISSAETHLLRSSSCASTVPSRSNRWTCMVNFR